VSGPSILSCESWGAQNPSDPVTVLNTEPSKIIVHHTATANTDQVGQQDLITLARSIQHYHMDHNDWIDTGQHFTVNRGGLIAEGRHRSLETLLGGVSFVEGTHCVDQNDVSIGIENEGTYTKVEPPGVLLAGLTSLLAYCAAQYKINPTQIYGHRDFNDTDCPGDKLHALLPGLRYEVARRLGASIDQTSAAQAAWPLLRPGDSGPAVLAAQHLLLNAGQSGFSVGGTFDSATVAALAQFQTSRGLAVSEMLAGGSWPLLAVPTSASDPGEAGHAVRVLLDELHNRARSTAPAGSPAGSTSPSPPQLINEVTPDSPVTTAQWQRLLDAVG
jgi:N-acetyl-anhydromuramyl-L-alanine amidase AmpD